MDAVEYKLVRSGAVEEFERAVEAALSEGWKLHGNTAVGARGDTTFYIQPMVKYAK